MLGWSRVMASRSISVQRLEGTENLTVPTRCTPKTGASARPEPLIGDEKSNHLWLARRVATDGQYPNGTRRGERRFHHFQRGDQPE